MQSPAVRKRRWLFHLSAIALVIVIAAGMLLAADVVLHYRLARYAAVNIWGYRGPIVGRKHTGERRVLVIGASTAFGVGYPPEDSFPAQLEVKLRARSPFPITVVNLGWPGEDAYAYRANLEDYSYLKPDVIIFYGDSNSSGGATPIVLRRLSPVFRLTGYYPLIDTALREKAMALRHGGNLGAAYREDKVVFQPGLATRTGASALAEAADVADSLHRVLGQLTRRREEPVVEMATCGPPWTRFCDAMQRAVSYARSLGLPVLVVNQPYFSDQQIQAQQAIQAMLRQQFGADRAVRYLDLGWAIDLRDSRLAYDGLHLTPAANGQIADQLIEPVQQVLSSLSKSGR